MRGKVRGLEGVDVDGRRSRQRARRRGQNASTRSLRGTGGVLLVSGDAGPREEPTARRAARAVRRRPRSSDRPKLWLEGRSLSYGERLAYAPITELLRDWLGTPAGEPQLRVQVRLRSRLEPLFGAGDLGVQPFLANLLGLPLDREAGARIASLSPQDLRAATFDAVAALLSRLAADGPVVVALDDLHWADGDTVDLVDRLLVLTESAAVLLVIALRPERTHPSWGASRPCAAGRTAPHHRSRAAATVGRRRGRTARRARRREHTLTADLKAELLDAAEGNPFYLEELVRALLAAGALDPRQRKATGDSTATRRSSCHRRSRR